MKTYNNQGNWKNGILYIGKHLVKATPNLISKYIAKNGTKTIADNAFDPSHVRYEAIVLPESLCRIGDYNFQKSNYLRLLHIPENVKYIGKYSFNNCVNLKAVILPENISKIGDYAFGDCKAISICAYEGTYAETFVKSQKYD